MTLVQTLRLTGSSKRIKGPLMMFLGVHLLLVLWQTAYSNRRGNKLPNESNMICTHMAGRMITGLQSDLVWCGHGKVRSA